jgi:hypothetical protein
VSILTEFGRAYLNTKGYPRLFTVPDRGMYVHRRSFEFIAGRRVRDGFHVHHQPNPRGKLCWCPHNLIQDVLHVKAEPPRNPWNGQFIDAEELRRMTA